MQAAIAETNYVPDLSAKKIRGRAQPQHHRRAGAGYRDHALSVEITLSIEETARAHGWNSFVVNMFSDDRPEAVVDLPLPPSGRHYLYHHGPAPVPLPENC